MSRLAVISFGLVVSLLAYAIKPLSGEGPSCNDLCAEYSEEDCSGEMKPPSSYEFCWAACQAGINTNWLICTWAPEPETCPSPPQPDPSCGGN